MKNLKNDQKEDKKEIQNGKNNRRRKNLKNDQKEDKEEIQNIQNCKNEINSEDDEQIEIIDIDNDSENKKPEWLNDEINRIKKENTRGSFKAFVDSLYRVLIEYAEREFSINGTSYKVTYLEELKKILSLLTGFICSISENNKEQVANIINECRDRELLKLFSNEKEEKEVGFKYLIGLFVILINKYGLSFNNNLGTWLKENRDKENKNGLEHEKGCEKKSSKRSERKSGENKKSSNVKDNTNFFTRSWGKRSGLEQFFWVLLNIPTLGIPAICNSCCCNNSCATFTKESVNEIIKI